MGRLKGRVASFTMVEHYDPKTGMSAMLRTTAFPTSIIVQTLTSGAICKRGGSCRSAMCRPICSLLKWTSAESRSTMRSNDPSVLREST